MDRIHMPGFPGAQFDDSRGTAFTVAGAAAGVSRCCGAGRSKVESASIIRFATSSVVQIRFLRGMKSLPPATRNRIAWWFQAGSSQRYEEFHRLLLCHIPRVVLLWGPYGRTGALHLSWKKLFVKNRVLLWAGYSSA